MTQHGENGIQMLMSNISQLSAAQLRRAAEVQSQIETLQAELAKVLGGAASSSTVRVAAVAPVKAAGTKRKLSAAGRARIIAASKAYWARVRAGAKPGAAKAVADKASAKKKPVISAAGRAKLAAIAKARWAKVRAAGKSRL